MVSDSPAAPAASPAFPTWPDAPRVAFGLLPGLILSALIAAVALVLADLPWFAAHGGSALTLAIVIGLAVGNTLYGRVAVPCTAGVNFSKQRLLRLGIVLYGLRLTFDDIGRVGLQGIAIDALMLGGTFGLAVWIGTRLLRMDRTTTMLIGAGSAICGAAAVMATGPVVRARSEQVAVAIATVVVFGTVAIFLYPALFEWNRAHGWIAISSQGFGLYIGSTVHEVAQVVAAAGAIGPETANTAVIAKLVRVMMLAPFLMALSAGLAFMAPKDGTVESERRRIVVPWFALGFVAVAGLNSLPLIPAPVRSAAIAVDTFLLAMAMAALGLTTHVSAIRKAGIKPLVLAAILFVWLIGGGFVVNQAVNLLFANGAG